MKKDRPLSNETAINSWKRPFKNAGILLLGRGTQAILSLVYLALAARSLGTIQFGILALIHGTAITAAQFLRFQSWQAIMRFGAEANEKKDLGRFQDIVSFSVWLDIISAAAGVIIIIALVTPLANILHMTDAHVTYFKYYMYGVIFIVLGSGPTGILRLFDRHDLISVQTVVEPIIRFVGAVILFYLSAPLAAFLAVWFAAMVCSRITMIAFAWRHLAALEKTKGMLRSFKRTASLSFLKDNTDLCRFVIGTHFTSTLNLNSLQLGTILSGWILGPAGAGLFRVAQQFADILVKPAQKLLIPAIYTDMAEYTAKGDHHTRRKMIIHTAMIATVISACVLGLFVVFGDTMLTLFAGEDYAEAHHLMLYLSLAGVLLIVTFPIEPLLITEGAVKKTCFIRFVTLVIYGLAFYYLGHKYGLNGAGYAAIIHALITSALLAIASRSFIGKTKA